MEDISKCEITEAATNLKTIPDQLTVSLSSKTINLCLTDCRQFHIPEIQESFAPKASSSAIELASSIHLRFRKEAQPDKNGQQIEKRAIVELKTIMELFPHVQYAPSLAAMSAWLSMVCLVDDMIEQMQPDAAHSILAEVPALLRPIRHDSPQLIPAQVTTIALAEQTNRKSTGKEDADLARQIRHIFQTTQNHLLALLPRLTYDDVCENMIHVFKAMDEEVSFRHSRTTDLDRYLDIRARTISLSPLFALLRHAIGRSQAQTDEIAQLENCVSITAGLQNDVVGLDKDIAQGESMNYPMVYASSQGLSNHDQAAVMAGASEAVDCHDVAAKHAVDMWQNMVRDHSEGVEVASSLLVLVSTHFKWVSKAKRYAA